MTVRAIYENGVFTPTEPVNLPEKSEVEFEPKIVDDDHSAQQEIYALLSQTFDSGQRDVAERHNEHQP